MRRKKALVILFGAVSKITGKFRGPGDLYRPGQYVNYRAVATALKRHIVEANPEYDVDFLIHGWNPDLQKDMVECYNPLECQLEDNVYYQKYIVDLLGRIGRPESSYALVSQALSIKRACWRATITTPMDYDLYIFTRPDIMVWKDFKLDSYNPDCVTLDNYQDFRGEMHFVTGPKHFLAFSEILQNIGKVCYPDEHTMYKSYFETKGIPLAQDDIVAGVDEAPLRYITVSSLKDGHVTREKLYTYGLTDQEIDSYVTIY